MTMQNKALVFRQVPNGIPIPGQDLAIETVACYDSSAEAPDGGLILESLYGSFDPYMRGRMRPASIKSNATAFELGQPVHNAVIAKVLKSNNARFKPDDIVIGDLPFQEYTVVATKSELDGIHHLDNPLEIEDIRIFLGALGMAGLTAYSSLYEIGKPQKGETIFVSAAYGAVGSLVGQLAKHEGLRVIGSVGSDQKLEFITKKLGFDAGFNYKTERPADSLRRLAPDGIDIYYENVGGEHLEAALDAMKEHGRIVVCGLISEYSNTGPLYPLQNYDCILRKRLTIRGFVVFDQGMGDKYHHEHQTKVGKWIKDGTFKAVTCETEGIDNAIDGLLSLFSGQNLGKAVLKF